MDTAGYVIGICIITGVLLLLTDAKTYKNRGLKREQKATKIMGWINVSTGVLLMAGIWLYHKLVW